MAEISKQRELSGTIDSETEAKMKQLSDAKCKELSGHDIFGPPEIPTRPLAARSLGLKESIDMGEPAPRNLRTSVKVSNVSSWGGNDLFILLCVHSFCYALEPLKDNSACSIALEFIHYCSHLDEEFCSIWLNCLVVMGIQDVLAILLVVWSLQQVVVRACAFFFLTHLHVHLCMLLCS